MPRSGPLAQLKFRPGFTQKLRVVDTASGHLREKGSVQELLQRLVLLDGVVREAGAAFAAENYTLQARARALARPHVSYFWPRLQARAARA